MADETTLAQNVYRNVMTGATPNPVITDPDEIDEEFVQAANDVLKRAAELAEVMLLTVRWVDIEAALSSLGDLSGKVILSTVNALKADMSELSVGTTTSAAEEIARRTPDASVVECILPFAEVLHAEDRMFGDARPNVFYCGDDAAAKDKAVPLLRELGVDPVDAGALSSARYIEPAGMLLVQMAYGHGRPDGI